MKKLCIYITFSCLLQGCIITQTHSIHHIINQNVNSFQKEKVDLDNFSAILKEFSYIINSKDSITLSELRKEKESFIKNLKSNNISNNYPVKANKYEIKTFQKFIDDICNTIHEKRIKRNVNIALKIYVEELIDEH